jgi:TPR repeat protein
MASRWSSEERKSYITAAEAGDAAAQMWLGWAYWEGNFIDVDLKQSKLWLERAAQSQHGEAQYRLALFCYHAVGENDIVIDLLRASVQNGCQAAAYELGNHYHWGLIVPKDRAQALSWWQYAAKSGHVLSEIQLIRAEFRQASWLKKPLVWAKLVPTTAKAARQFWKNPNDPSVLGAPI